MKQLIKILVYKPYQWAEMIDNTIKVTALLQEYNICYITIKAEDNNLYQYKLNDFNQVYTVKNTISILDFINNVTVFPSRIYPIKTLDNKKYVRYSDLFMFGLNAQRVNHMLDINNQVGGYNPDLLITNLTTNYSQLSDYIDKLLFLVNGEIFKSTVYNNNVLLTNSTKRLDVDKFHHLSVIDFTACNGFSIIPFSSLNLNVTNSSDIETTVKVNIPLNIRNKVLLVVINRKLYILSNHYQIIEDEMYLTINHNRLLSMIHNLNALDLSWVQPMNSNDNGFIKMSVDIIKCLNTDQSFIIALNTDKLGIEEEYLLKTKIPMRYSYNGFPLGIATAVTGEILDYSFTTNTPYGTEIIITKPHNSLRLIDTVPEDQMAAFDNSDYSFESDTFDAKIHSLYII